MEGAYNSYNESAMHSNAERRRSCKVQKERWWMSGKRSRPPVPKPKSVSETQHLLRSPKNERLLKALDRAKKGIGEPQTVEELMRDDLGLNSAG
jgi:hypothetical protein